MVHPFCCCFFSISKRGRLDYCSFSDIKYETSRFCAENPSPGTWGQEGTTWFSQSCYKQPGTADIWSHNPHHDSQNTPWDLNETCSLQKGTKAGDTKSTREQERLKTSQSSHHNVKFSILKDTVLLPIPIIPGEKNRQKINLLAPIKEFWNKLYTTHIINHRRPLPTNDIPLGS